MKKIKKYSLVVLLPLLVCSTFLFAADVDSSTSTKLEQLNNGKIIWADLYTSDVQSSLSFYINTFGLTEKSFTDNNIPYHILYDGTQPVAGVIKRSAQRNQTKNALWIGSIATDNVQRNVDKASDNKATILFTPHKFPFHGERAVIADPQGGVIALLDLDESNKAHKNLSNKWDWAQLFSIDTSKASTFYQTAFEYKAEPISDNNKSVYLIKQQEVRASIASLPAEFEQRDLWVNFLTVDNLSSILKKATINGAIIIYQPQDGNLAIIADPNGALIGLTEQESQ